MRLIYLFVNESATHTHAHERARRVYKCPLVRRYSSRSEICLHNKKTL